MANILVGRSRGCILSTPLPALDPNYDFSELPLRLYESLTDPQRAVYDSTSRFKLLCSGRRFGKTYLCITRLINWAIEKPGSLNWYVTANYRMAKQIAWRQLRQMVPTEVFLSKNEAELTIELLLDYIINDTEPESKTRDQYAQQFKKLCVVNDIGGIKRFDPFLGKYKPKARTKKDENKLLELIELVRPNKKNDVAPPHTDKHIGGIYRESNIRFLSLWVPLNEIGCKESLALARSSHNKSHPKSELTESNGKLSICYKESYFNKFKIVRPRLQLGQGIVFDGNILHGGAYNSLNSTRVSIEIRFYPKNLIESLYK